MKLDVFDTYITRSDGEMMHFDVLLPEGSTKQEAERYAMKWLKSIGVQTHNLRLDKCRFCHSETAYPEIGRAILSNGYAILQMEGCPSPV